jgi:hypothetical protein
MDELTRLLTRVQRGPGCWLWTGATNDKGYGQVRRVRDGRSVIVYVHRLLYELLVGPIPEGHELDHIKANGCTSTACVKVLADEHGPAHLEPVTHAENQRRGDGASGRNARKTHCDNGHEFTPENTARHALGHRVCIACRRANTRKANVKYRARLRAEGRRWW